MLSIVYIKQPFDVKSTLHQLITMYLLA